MKPRSKFPYLLAAIALALTLAGSLLVTVLTQNTDDLSAIQREGAERRDQTCLLFEGEHSRDVARLRSTYKYLTGLTAAQRRMPLNVAVLGGLPQTEEDAIDRAPSYCDEPDVGLPEPDPILPCRPKELQLPVTSPLAAVCGRRVQTHRRP